VKENLCYFDDMLDQYVCDEDTNDTRIFLQFADKVQKKLEIEICKKEYARRQAQCEFFVPKSDGTCSYNFAGSYLTTCRNPSAQKDCMFIDKLEKL